MSDVDQLLSRLTAPAPLRPDQVARIRAAIDEDRHTKRVPRFALAGVLCLALCGFAAAAVYGIAQTRAPEVAPAPDVPEVQAPPAPKHAIGHAAVAPRPPAAIAPAPEEAPPPAPPPKPIVSPVRGHAPVRVAPAPAPARIEPTVELVAEPVAEPVRAEPSDAALAAESQLVATSLRQLRKERSAKAALATLDRYAAEFPHGVLAEEARATRVEALIALGDRRAALALLDTMQVGTELGVVRGELRLASGRPDEAARDFTAVLIGARDDLEARALFGRAACRTRLGDRDGAREDLAAYVQRFPKGPQAAAARAALANLDESVKGLPAARP